MFASLFVFTLTSSGIKNSSRCVYCYVSSSGSEFANVNTTNISTIRDQISHGVRTNNKFNRNKAFTRICLHVFAWERDERKKKHNNIHNISRKYPWLHNKYIQLLRFRYHSPTIPLSPSLYLTTVLVSNFSGTLSGFPYSIIFHRTSTLSCSSLLRRSVCGRIEKWLDGEWLDGE